MNPILPTNNKGVADSINEFAQSKNNGRSPSNNLPIPTDNIPHKINEPNESVDGNKNDTNPVVKGSSTSNPPPLDNKPIAPTKTSATQSKSKTASTNIRPNFFYMTLNITLTSQNSLSIKWVFWVLGFFVR